MIHIKITLITDWLTCIMSLLKAPYALNDLGAKFIFHVYTMDTHTHSAFWPITTLSQIWKILVVSLLLTHQCSISSSGLTTTRKCEWCVKFFFENNNFMIEKETKAIVMVVVVEVLKKKQKTI